VLFFVVVTFSFNSIGHVNGEKAGYFAPVKRLTGREACLQNDR